MNRFFRDGNQRIFLLVLVPITLLLLPFFAWADSPQMKPDKVISSGSLPKAAAIMKQMKETFEPEGPSLSRVLLTVKSPSAYSDGYETVETVAGLAVKNFPDGKRMLLVMLQPDDTKGTAFLIKERKEPDDVMWDYLPAIRRVREIKYIGRYQTFFGTDFTYADLGFIKLRGHYTYLGEEERNGVRAYKIQENVPQELMFYGKIITWVAADSRLPVERDFYAPAGQLIKKEVFQAASIVEGMPMALRIRMTDVEQDTSTEMDIQAVEYDATLPDSLFDAKQLPTVSGNPIWKSCLQGTTDQGKK